MWQNADVRIEDKDILPNLFPGSFSTIKTPEKAFSAELQHLFRSQYVNVTTGAGFFDIVSRLDLSFGLNFPPFGVFTTEDRTRLNLTHYNLYSYANIHPIRTLTFTLGLSADITEGDSTEVAGKLNRNDSHFAPS